MVSGALPPLFQRAAALVTRTPAKSQLGSLRETCAGRVAVAADAAKELESFWWLTAWTRKATVVLPERSLVEAKVLKVSEAVRTPAKSEDVANWTR